jgi:peptidoglycan/LPS O-acetylase OafA/YrhL
MTAAVLTKPRTTPAPKSAREPVVDGVRAVAMVGVVLGHWLVTGLALGTAGDLRNASPLKALPGLAPVSWLLETLGLFFFAAGYAAARSSAARSSGARATGAGRGRWIAGRLGRLVPPVVVFLAVWAVVLAALAAHGAADRTLWTVGKLAISPLWFLAVLVGLSLLTPAARAAVRRWGALAALGPLAVVVTVDLVRFGLWPDAPGQLGWVNVVAAWLVPYLLGIAAAQGRLPARGTGPVLLVAGALGALALVRWGGYPVSMVGVPGQGRSNLDPPSLVVVCLALAQIGAVLCLWQPLSRLLRRPLPLAVARQVNQRIFSIFLWHQSALLLVTGVTLALAGPLAGLVQRPTGTDWIVHRVLWLPVLLAVLAGLCALLHPVERLRPRRGPVAGRERDGARAEAG